MIIFKISLQGRRSREIPNLKTRTDLPGRWPNQDLFLRAQPRILLYLLGDQDDSKSSIMTEAMTWGTPVLVWALQ